MKSFNILILEDDLKTLAVIMNVLSQIEEEMKCSFTVTTYSTYKDVEEIVNRRNSQSFHMVLLDRDCKLGGNFHVLDIETLGPSKIIAISSVSNYNEETLARGVQRVITKDYDNLQAFALKLGEQIRRFLSRYVI